MKEVTSSFIRTLVSLQGALDPLPEERSITSSTPTGYGLTMAVKLYMDPDRTPCDYFPTHFVPSRGAQKTTHDSDER